MLQKEASALPSLNRSGINRVLSFLSFQEALIQKYPGLPAGMTCCHEGVLTKARLKLLCNQPQERESARQSSERPHLRRLCLSAFNRDCSLNRSLCSTFTSSCKPCKKHNIVSDHLRTLQQRQGSENKFMHACICPRLPARKGPAAAATKWYEPLHAAAPFPQPCASF